MGYNMDRAFKKIERTVEFDTGWANGTGYFDGAVRAKLGLKPGERAKSVDKTGRRIIFVGTRFGNAVFFDRYSPNTDSADVVVSNVPDVLRPFVPSGKIPEDDQARLFAYDGSMNIGADIENLFREQAEEETA